MMIQSAWKENINMHDNLKKLQEDLKNWKHDTLDQVRNKKKEIMAQMNGIKKCIQRSDNKASLIKLEKILQLELSDILKK